MTDISDLGLVSDLWEYWGFSPWNSDGMKGVCRRVTFVKSALIGEVCRYYADDYIIWSHHGKADRQRILKSCRPQPDLRRSAIFSLRERNQLRNVPSGRFFSVRGMRRCTPYARGRFENGSRTLPPSWIKRWNILRHGKASLEVVYWKNSGSIHFFTLFSFSEVNDLLAILFLIAIVLFAILL